MKIRAALLGAISAEAMLALKQLTQEDVVFDPVFDLTDTSRVQEAIELAHVVVGTQWPSGAGAAPNLRLIQHTGAGIDSYPRSALPPDAYLCNVYEHEQSLAEHVFMVMLALRRDLLSMDRDLRQGNWGKSASGNIPQRLDIAGLTMGVIGFGRIGRALVEPARAFGLEVIGVTGHEVRGVLPEGVRFLGGPDSIDKVLKEADVIVVATPLNEQTRGLISDREFSLMKATALLINVARGPVVDEAAFFHALRNRRIAGAGIDVWYRYPSGVEQCLPSKYPFQDLGNVILTPHLAGWTKQTAARRWKFIARNIDHIARGEEPENIVWQPRGSSNAGQGKSEE